MKDPSPGPLSPTAQAIFDAFGSSSGSPYCLDLVIAGIAAFALRAAAAQFRAEMEDVSPGEYCEGAFAGITALEEIAAELDGGSHG